MGKSKTAAATPEDTTLVDEAQKLTEEVAAYNVEDHARRLHAMWVDVALAVPGVDQRDPRYCVWEILDEASRAAFYARAQARHDQGLEALM